MNLCAVAATVGIAVAVAVSGFASAFVVVFVVVVAAVAAVAAVVAAAGAGGSLTVAANFGTLTIKSSTRGTVASVSLSSSWQKFPNAFHPSLGPVRIRSSHCSILFWRKGVEQPPHGFCVDCFQDARMSVNFVVRRYRVHPDQLERILGKHDLDIGPDLTLQNIGQPLVYLPWDEARVQSTFRLLPLPNFSFSFNRTRRGWY